MSHVVVELDGAQLQKPFLTSQVDVNALGNLELMGHYLDGVHLHPLVELNNQFQREHCETR